MKRRGRPSTTKPLKGKRRSLPEKHVTFVQRKAFHMKRKVPMHIDYEDLVSAGHEGLVIAASRWDPQENDNFEAFAEHRIVGAMQDELRSRDRLKRDTRIKSNEMQRAESEVRKRVNREPTAEEMAKQLGLPLERFFALRAQMSTHHVELDDKLSSVIRDQDAEDPLAACLLKECRSLVAGAIKRLPQRISFVLWLSYIEGQTLKEIAKALGVTESRACQMRAQGVDMLRQELDGMI